MVTVMGARWMQAKKIKMARERRAWAKPYTIKNSAGPNWHNRTIARNISLDLSEEVRLRNEAATRKPRIPDITEVRKEIPDPFFNVIVDNPYHRCRVYWNSTRTKFILQYVLWWKGEVRISIAYPSFTRANYVFQTERVRWRITKKFTPSS